MPTLVQVRNFVDGRLATLWTGQIVPRQDAYFAANGKYWQGVRTTTLALCPNNPSDASPSVLEVVPTMTVKPTDQAEDWTAAGINLGATVPMAFEIHSYNGPQGKGYVGIVWARWNGNVYTRSQNFGPETWRTEPWAQVVTGP